MYKNIDFFKKMIEKNKTINEVSEICNVTPKTISNWEKRFDIKLKRSFPPGNRIHKLNENYFDVIDTENKAYFLGLLAADGYLITGNKGISIALQNRDSYILEMLIKDIESDYVLHHKKNGTLKVLNLCSKKMAVKLNSLGIVKNKTKYLTFPDINKKYINHYLRGYFDGDGYIGERACRLIISSKYFLEGLIKNIDFDFNIKEFGNYYHLDFYKKDCRFIKYIYEDSKIFLNRKKEKYNLYWKTL